MHELTFKFISRTQGYELTELWYQLYVKVVF